MYVHLEARNLQNVVVQKCQVLVDVLAVEVLVGLIGSGVQKGC